MVTLTVIDFAARDAEPLVHMWRESFEFGVGVPNSHPLEDQLAYLTEQLVPTHRVRVAWRGDTIVGFLASTPSSISQLYVRVANVGQGVGTCLLNLAKSESSGSLWLFAFQRNTRACRFYEHHGFVAVARGIEPTSQLADVKYLWARPKGAA